MKMKMMVVAMFLAVASFAGIAEAQSCGASYAERDQNSVRRILVGPIYNSNPDGVGPALLRMHELAVMSTDSQYSQLQRMALNNEYLAWLLEIDRIGGHTGPRLALRTRAWLDRVIDPAFLGLSGTSILGSTIEESQVNARAAALATAEAIQRMWSCY